VTRIQKPAAAFAACILLAACAHAQSKGSGDNDADQKELYNYALSMDKIQKIASATRELQALAKQHPDINDNSDAKNLDATVAKIQKYPEAVAVIKKNGLSPREYVVGIMTVMQASMAVGFKKSGTYKDYPPKMLQLVSKANLEFVEQHWDEMQKLTKMDSDDK
jgi:hypothetical protein